MVSVLGPSGSQCIEFFPDIYYLPFVFPPPSSCSDGSTAEFVFTTEQDSTAKEILGMWNICLLELINTNTEKLNGNSPRTDASEGRSRHIQRSISVKTTNGRGY